MHYFLVAGPGPNHSFVSSIEFTRQNFQMTSSISWSPCDSQANCFFFFAEDSNGFEGWSHETDESDIEWSQSEFCSVSPVLAIKCC